MSDFRITDAKTGRTVFSEQREPFIDRHRSGEHVSGLDEECPDYRRSAMTHEFVKLMVALENTKLTKVPNIEQQGEE